MHDLHLFRFPKDQERFHHWLRILQRDTNTRWSKTAFICSRHFDTSDYVEGKIRRILRRNAVPHKNLVGEKASGEVSSDLSVTEKVVSQGRYLKSNR